MWHALALLVASLLQVFAGSVEGGSVDSSVNVLSGVPTVLFTLPATALALFGLVIDWHIFFGCLAAAMVWRGMWLSYRVYRVVVGFLPLPG